LGKLADYDYNYNKIITKEKQQGFFYYNTKGKLAGKAESVQKSIKRYTLMKKGYVNGNYTSVCDKNIVVIKPQPRVICLSHLNKDFWTFSY
jgi:hypothetical protein